MKMIEHEFRCLNCGNTGIPIQRKRSHLHEKFHRKKLYCYHCKCDINFIEIRSDEEREEFLYNFNNGEYADEAKLSMEAVN